MPLSDYDKASTIIARFELMLGHPIFKTPDEILKKCRNSAELDYWYQVVCKDNYCEKVVI